MHVQKVFYNLTITAFGCWWEVIMGWESSDAVRFDLGPLQGQTRIAKLKSAYNSLIIGLRRLQEMGIF